MKWQIVRNNNFSSRDIEYPGECSNFNERAILSIQLSGKQMCKSDLKLTFTPCIKECSLLKEKHEKNTACMISCSVLEEYKNSHDY